ncbi:hypothetical protein [Actinomadura macra]|nr:hypothetical protein [Actinomadura macra]
MSLPPWWGERIAPGIIPDHIHPYADLRCGVLVQPLVSTQVSGSSGRES